MCIALWDFIYDLLFNWVGIYLYLVIANKILTNLIKSGCLVSTISLVSLTLHFLLHTCWAMTIRELMLAINNAQVKNMYRQRRTTTMMSLERSRTSSPSQPHMWRSYLSLIYFIYLFCKTFRYLIKLVTLATIQRVAICVKLDPDTHMRCIWIYP